MFVLLRKSPIMKTLELAAQKNDSRHAVFPEPHKGVPSSTTRRSPNQSGNQRNELGISEHPDSDNRRCKSRKTSKNLNFVPRVHRFALRVASRFCRYASYIVGIEWELRGLEHWDNEQSCIVISNHQSSLDILGMFEMWPRMKRCTVVAKRPLMFTGAFGFGAWLSGLVFIDRLKTDRARQLMKEAAERIIKEKTKLWIFPEGTRYNKGCIQPFKKGAFYLAIDAQIPLMPVVFSQYYFLDNESKTFEPGKVVITTLPPIPTKGMTRDDLSKLSEMARQQMIDTFKETSSHLVIERKVAL